LAGWKSEGWASNSGTSKQPFTLGHLKQQIFSASVCLYRLNLKDFKTRMQINLQHWLIILPLKPLNFFSVFKESGFKKIFNLYSSIEFKE